MVKYYQYTTLTGENTSTVPATLPYPYVLSMTDFKAPVRSFTMEICPI
jgi:hypothetical protein